MFTQFLFSFNIQTIILKKSTNSGSLCPLGRLRDFINKGHKQGIEISRKPLAMTEIASFKKDVSLSITEYSLSDKKEQLIKFRDLQGKERIDFIHKELRTIITTLLLHKTLNQQKMNKILSLSIPFNEAMNLKLTNTYSYIIYLIRKNNIDTAKVFLTRLTDHMNRYQDQLYSKIEKEIKIYRQLDKISHSVESESDSGEYVERPKHRKRKQKQRLADNQKVIFKNTFISGGKLMRKEQMTCLQADNVFIPFTRITKQSK